MKLSEIATADLTSLAVELPNPGAEEPSPPANTTEGSGGEGGSFRSPCTRQPKRNFASLAEY